MVRRHRRSRRRNPRPGLEDEAAAEGVAVAEVVPAVGAGEYGRSRSAKAWYSCPNSPLCLKKFTLTVRWKSNRNIRMAARIMLRTRSRCRGNKCSARCARIRKYCEKRSERPALSSRNGWVQVNMYCHQYNIHK